MVHTYILKYTRLQVEIIRLLSVKAGEKLNQRQIANFLNVTPRAVAISLPLLIKQELVTYTKSKTMNLIQIEFNSKNKKALQLKRVENLRIIYESEIIDELESLYPHCEIILFGDYSQGKDIINSEIQFAISSDLPLIQKHMDAFLEQKEKLFERKIKIHLVSKSESTLDTLQKEISKGVILSGGL